VRIEIIVGGVGSVDVVRHCKGSVVPGRWYT
jgi:hypothetical protein